MKAYTDLEQSKKLVEILPVESADMCFVNDGTSIKIDANPYNVRKHMWKDVQLIPCWSLAALLNVLPKGTDIIKEEADTENERYMCTVGIKDDIIPTFGNNPVDACYEMILKLHELNLL
jgi:hypothetical protein